MTTKYFPIFKSAPLQQRKKVIDVDPPVEVVEQSPKTCCMICYKSVNDMDSIINSEDSYLFQNYIKLLGINILPKMQLDFGKEKLPFCKECLVKVEFVTSLQDKLNFMLRQIKKSVLSMKILILKTEVHKMNITDSKRIGVPVELPSYREKVDYFRRLAVQDFTPEVVLKPRNSPKIRNSDTIISHFRVNPLEVSKADFEDDIPLAVFKNQKQSLEHKEIDISRNVEVSPVLVNLSCTPLKSELSNLDTKNGSSNTSENKKVTQLNLKRAIRHRPMMSLSPVTQKLLENFVIALDAQTTDASEANEVFEKIGNITWQCKLCQKQLITKAKASLRRHIDCIHKNVKRFQCRLCSNRFYEASRCKRHLRQTHKNEIAVPTGGDEAARIPGARNRPRTVDLHNDCKGSQSKVGMSMPTVYSIFKAFFRKKATHYQCRLCSSRIMLRSNLKRHVLSLHGPVEKYTCKYCKIVILSEVALAKHVQVTHDKENKNKVVKNVIKHKKSKTSRPHFSKDVDISEKQSVYVGSVRDDSLDGKFDKVLKTSSNVLEKSEKPQVFVGEQDNIPKEHQEANDNQETQIVVAGSQLEHETTDTPTRKRQRNMSQSPRKKIRNNEYPPHIERGIIRMEETWTQYKEFFNDLKSKDKVQCKKCKVTVTKNKSIRHVLGVHKSAGRYNCKYCGKTFFYKSECALHIRVKHYMEKPFNCPRCPEAFCTLIGKASHMKKCMFYPSIV